VEDSATEHTATDGSSSFAAVTVSGSAERSINTESGIVSLTPVTVSGTAERVLTASGAFSFAGITTQATAGLGQLAYLRPNADTTVGSWTTNTGATTNLFEAIDEVSANDSDYIQSEASPSASVTKIALSNPATNVQTDMPHRIRYRYRKATNDSTVNLTVRLIQGASTTIATWTHNNISTTIAESEQTLTAPQVASITDYDDLHIEFEADEV